MAIATAQAPVGTFLASPGTTVGPKAYTSNVTAGNLLVATFGIDTSTTATLSVSGSLNGAFTALPSSLATNASAVFRVQTFYKVATSSGAETITATSTISTTARELVIYEFSGADTASIPDAQNAATGSSTNPTGSITVVTQPGVIVAYAMSTAGTISAGSGYTLAVAQNGDAGQYKFYSATGATSVPTVDGTTGQWAMTMASFKAAAGGGGTVVKTLATQGVGR